MNDLQARLTDLADDLAPDADPYGQIAGARSLHRRRRRTRIAIAGAAVAVALIAVGVPTIVGTQSAPERGDVAAPTATTSAPSSAIPPEGELPGSTAEDLRTVLTQVGAGPVPDPSLDQPCPDAAGMLSTATDMLAVEPVPLNAGSSLIGGCAWSTVPERIGPEKDRYDLLLVARPDATADEMRATVEESGTVPDCGSTRPLGEDFFNAVLVCTNDDRVAWTLIVVDEDGTGVWELTTAVGTRMPERYGLGLSGTSSLWRLVLSFVTEESSQQEASRLLDMASEQAQAALEERPEPRLRAPSDPLDCNDGATELTALFGPSLTATRDRATAEDMDCAWVAESGGVPVTVSIGFLGNVDEGKVTDAAVAAVVDHATGTSRDRDGSFGGCYTVPLNVDGVVSSLVACGFSGRLHLVLGIQDAGGAGIWTLQAEVSQESAVEAPDALLQVVNAADSAW